MRGIIAGFTAHSGPLTHEEKAILQDPNCLGIILDGRSFYDQTQVSDTGKTIGELYVSFDALTDSEARSKMKETILALKARIQENIVDATDMSAKRVRHYLKRVREELHAVGRDPKQFWIGGDFEKQDIWRLQLARGLAYGAPYPKPYASFREIGERYETANPQEQEKMINELKDYAQDLGEKLMDLGINLNFSPVLDTHDPESSIIGGLGRAFSSNPETIKALAGAMIDGYASAGLTPCLKHFINHGPGHIRDTHLHRGEDDLSSLESLMQHIALYADLAQKYQAQSASLCMIMTSHIIHSAYDSNPVSHSSYWMEQLRQRVGEALVVTDCILMQGSDADDKPEKMRMAFKAGINLVLISPQQPLKDQLEWLQALESTSPVYRPKT